jgi:hypothetical protein
MDKKILIMVGVAVLALSIVYFMSERQVTPRILNATDTDGTRTAEIIASMASSHEKVILKVNPFGYVAVGGWENTGLAKSVQAIIEWKTYKDFGAGNIYIGYSFGGNYTEVGPFDESDEFVQTSLDIPVNIFTDLGKLRVRFRGEDTDFGPDAIAEVSIKLRVTDYGF